MTTLPVRLKISLPPNLDACAPRDAVPTKVEIVDKGGRTYRPETLDEAEFANLDENSRIAAFKLKQWCGGSFSSFVQLSREQLSQLATSLANAPAFYWVNKPA
ncbi:MAG: hypothetical protein VYC82_02045, partial [Verrucomicrobiota bacterium]|nr:hypothetical protein [Verrucomicrobiota bacterium]